MTAGRAVESGATRRVLVNVAWPAEATPDLADVVAAVTGAGADGIGVPDSPRIFPDPFVQSERLLAGTDAALAGPCVLSLGLRHPATVGAGLRTLAERHGDRVVGVLARGESSLRNEQLATPPLGEYLDALETVSDVLGPAARAVTLLGAASGPRTLAATGERLGGVLIDVGISPVVVAGAVDAARAAGPQVRCWLFVRALATDDPAVARAASTTLLGSCAMRMAAAPEWYRVPEALRDEVARVAAAHDYRTHGRETAVSEGAGPDLVRDRFFLAGPATDVRDRLRRLTGPGVDGVVLAGATGGLVDRLPATVAALRAGVQVQESG